MNSYINNEKEIVGRIDKNLLSIKSYCKIIINKYKKTSSRMSDKDYIYLFFSTNITYRIEDIIFISKKLKEVKNSADSSLYILSKSVLETFIYLKYLLSEEDKITLRLNSFSCYMTDEDKKVLRSLKEMGVKKKFIFSNDNNDQCSLKMMNEKISEFEINIEKYKNFKKNISPAVEKEINVLKSVKETAKKYDDIKEINSVKRGEEVKSLEWMYNYVYRFQCRFAHSSLGNMEKEFSRLYTENKKEPNHTAILSLMEELSKQIVSLQ